VGGAGPVGSRFCDQPGSVQFTNEGTVTVPGGGSGASRLSFLHLPVGFCAHHFGNVGNARQLRFAPGGELFVASPTAGTTGGGLDGRASIAVLPDDDGDGEADTVLDYLDDLPSTQGLLFADGYLYYQDGTRIRRMPYKAGDRVPSGVSEEVASVTVYSSGLHWPKTLDQADDGTIYVANGGDQGESCDPSHPFHGGILKLDGTPGGALVARGFRNPIAVRCQRGRNRCYAVELAMDYTAMKGGREKLVPIREGDDWGFPCCFSRDIPSVGITPVPDCSNIAPESVSFIIGNTPFGVDFELGKWPAPYRYSGFVTLHGEAGSWAGARIVQVSADPNTGELLPGTDLSGASTGAMSDFATGWDDGTLAHGRPAAVVFAEDGRLFVSNDNDGNIFWIAPLTLER
jgi:glucose/arabinose dehydrogenase